MAVSIEGAGVLDIAFHGSMKKVHKKGHTKDIKGKDVLIWNHYGENR